MQTQESQAQLDPAAALQALRDGHDRFKSGTPTARRWTDEIAGTATGQFPFAFVLGCIDSRIPVETLFDQGVGDIFTGRVAGNVINEDLIASMEFACKAVGSRAILVLGHTACGAIRGAIDDVDLGHLPGLVGKIKPAVEQVRSEMSADADGFMDRVASIHAERIAREIAERSPILAAMKDAGEIAIASAVYDVRTGAVDFQS